MRTKHKQERLSDEPSRGCTLARSLTPLKHTATGSPRNSFPTGLLFTQPSQRKFSLFLPDKHSNQETILKQLCFGKFFFQSRTVHPTALQPRAPATIRRKSPNVSSVPLIQMVLIHTKVSTAYLSEQGHTFSFPNDFLNILLSFPPRKFIHSM